MPGGSGVGLVIHFDKEAPDALEQWLRSEARYIIGAFGKAYDLEKVYGAQTNAILAECRRLGDKVVTGITMILDADMRKLELALVRLRNGKAFLIDAKYRFVDDAGTMDLVEALVKGDSPRAFSVTSK